MKRIDINIIIDAVCTQKEMSAIQDRLMVIRTQIIPAIMGILQHKPADEIRQPLPDEVTRKVATLYMTASHSGHMEKEELSDDTQNKDRILEELQTIPDSSNEFTQFLLSRNHERCEFVSKTLTNVMGDLLTRMMTDAMVAAKSEEDHLEKSLQTGMEALAVAGKCIHPYFKTPNKVGETEIFLRHLESNCFSHVNAHRIKTMIRAIEDGDPITTPEEDDGMASDTN